MLIRVILSTIILLFGLAVPGLAQTGTPAPQVSFDFTCMQLAVERRDNLIILAFGEKTSAIQSALTQRRDALKSAWGQTNARQRRQLRAVAWASYREVLADIIQDYRQASRNIWNQFKTTAKNCRAPSGESGIDVSSSGNDQGL